MKKNDPRMEKIKIAVAMVRAGSPVRKAAKDNKITEALVRGACLAMGVDLINMQGSKERLLERERHTLKVRKSKRYEGTQKLARASISVTLTDALASYEFVDLIRDGDQILIVKPGASARLMPDLLTEESRLEPDPLVKEYKP